MTSARISHPIGSIVAQSESCDSGEGAGYAHANYAASLAEFGTPRYLPRCGGWILERQIPNTPYRDAMGCYPIFSCMDWSNLRADLQTISPNDLVSLSVVADPFGDYTPANMHECFNAEARPFKEHFVVDLSRSMSASITSHHRRYAKKGLRELVIERTTDPTIWTPEWVDLYGHLIARHGITGISAFSPRCLAKQLAVPGVHAFRTSQGSTVVGMVLWYVRGNVGYYHLGAYSPAGYELRASFPLFWSAIEYFAESGLHWLDLGAGAGASNDGKDGLSSFKKGWSSGTKTAYLCGHIFDQHTYNKLLTCPPRKGTNYFPAYRLGEFA